MAYSIDVLCVGEDLYADIEPALEHLNSAQTEFVFAFPPTRLRHDGLPLKRQEYHTNELWEFLRTYRETAKGHRPFLIAVLNATLRSDNLAGLFGSHEAGEGLAAFTLVDQPRYVPSRLAFICYFLVRYSLSFIAPSLVTHEDTRACFFDKKRNKRDLLESLESLENGRLCDACRRDMQQNLSYEVSSAVDAMINVLKDSLAPGNLVMLLSGGGLRATLFQLGIFVFLAEVKKLDNIKEIVSVSGGSILAAHFVKNWQKARTDAAGFANVSASLVKFSRSDIRHRIVIPWIWSRLYFRWWNHNLSRTARLERVYKKHFGETTLGKLARTDSPRIALVATDGIKNEQVVFSADLIIRFSLRSQANSSGQPKTIVSRGVELSVAVAASSCFPPVFRRMHLKHDDLGLNFDDFDETLCVNDGGVTDNLGIGSLLALRQLGWGTEAFTLLGDAVRAQRAKPSGRASADLDAQGRALLEAQRNQIKMTLGKACRLVSLVDRPDESKGLDFRTQTKLAVFRTDFDAPTWPEVHALILHGAVAAADAMAQVSTDASLERIRATIATIIKDAGGPENAAVPREADLKMSYRRPMARVFCHALVVSILMLGIILGILLGLSWVVRQYHKDPPKPTASSTVPHDGDGSAVPVPLPGTNFAETPLTQDHHPTEPNQTASTEVTHDRGRSPAPNLLPGRQFAEPPPAPDDQPTDPPPVDPARLTKQSHDRMNFAVGIDNRTNREIMLWSYNAMYPNDDRKQSRWNSELTTAKRSKASTANWYGGFYYVVVRDVANTNPINRDVHIGWTEFGWNQPKTLILFEQFFESKNVEGTFKIVPVEP